MRTAAVQYFARYPGFKSGRDERVHFAKLKTTEGKGKNIFLHSSKSTKLNVRSHGRVRACLGAINESLLEGIARAYVTVSFPIKDTSTERVLRRRKLALSNIRWT